MCDRFVRAAVKCFLNVNGVLLCTDSFLSANNFFHWYPSCHLSCYLNTIAISFYADFFLLITTFMLSFMPPVLLYFWIRLIIIDLYGSCLQSNCIQQKVSVLKFCLTIKTHCFTLYDAMTVTEVVEWCNKQQASNSQLWCWQCYHFFSSICTVQELYLNKNGVSLLKDFFIFLLGKNNWYELSWNGWRGFFSFIVLIKVNHFNQI